MYADKVTRSMEAAITTTRDRRVVQEAYNVAHGITATGIQKAMRERMQAQAEIETADIKPLNIDEIPKDERMHLIKELSAQMQLASENLQFEKAAALRDQIQELKGKLEAIKKPRRATRK